MSIKQAVFTSYARFCVVCLNFKILTYETEYS